ncbi:hypothetical protein VTN02DRAFT_5565 [Thermoascus thermophilus]
MQKTLAALTLARATAADISRSLAAPCPLCGLFCASVPQPLPCPRLCRPLCSLFPTPEVRWQALSACRYKQQPSLSRRLVLHATDDQQVAQVPNPAGRWCHGSGSPGRHSPTVSGDPYWFGFRIHQDEVAVCCSRCTVN